MSNKLDGGPAFPMAPSNTTYTSCSPGMSLRDYFAAAALTGIKANDDLLKRLMAISKGVAPQQDFIAKMAYADADAMIAERSRQ